MELHPNGRFPGIRTNTDKLTMRLEKLGEEVVVRCDSDQFPEFWMEGRCKLRELLEELLSEEPT